MKSALFITYDGLLDPLGESQIIPYLRTIAAQPRAVHVLSFEKPERDAADGNAMRVRLEAMGIGWTPLRFTRRMGKMGKAWDLLRMLISALSLQSRHRFGIVHCRSYQAMQTGSLLKRLFRIRAIFDMRGLWVDERVDGGLWNRARIIDAIAFRIYKHIERKMLERADHVVALTNRVVPELRRLAPRMTAATTVIPCCADFAHFRILAPEKKNLVRRGLGIREDAFLLLYQGSLGTWYLFDEMVRFFAYSAAQRPDLHFLIVTRDWHPEHEHTLRKSATEAIMRRLTVTSADRDRMPELVGCADLMLSFIKPAYSKIASSPTKLAEAFACGVPVIANRGIGDVDQQIDSLSAGRLLDPSSTGEMTDVIRDLDAVRMLGGSELRQRASDIFDLEIAANSYRGIYDRMDAQ